MDKFGDRQSFKFKQLQYCYREERSIAEDMRLIAMVRSIPLIGCLVILPKNKNIAAWCA
jgi:hypothetical protein